MKIETSVDWVEILFPAINARGKCVGSVTIELVPVLTPEELLARLHDFKRNGWPVWIAGNVCYVFVVDEHEN